MREILEILGLDTSDDSPLAQTPERIASMYVDTIFSGLEPSHFPRISLLTEAVPQEMVLVKNITFISTCEHHFVPILGRAHVAYYPNKKLLGLGNIPQIVRYFAARPQLQERLTFQIADSLSSTLDTEDIAVILSGLHFCTLDRGVEDRTTEMETHSFKGRFETDPLVRTTLLSRLSSLEKSKLEQKTA